MLQLPAEFRASNAIITYTSNDHTVQSYWIKSIMTRNMRFESTIDTPFCFRQIPLLPALLDCLGCRLTEDVGETKPKSREVFALYRNILSCGWKIFGVGVTVDSTWGLTLRLPKHDSGTYAHRYTNRECTVQWKISKPCLKLKRHRNSIFELSFGREKRWNKKQKISPKSFHRRFLSILKD